MTDLTDLIARVENGEGADREIDLRLDAYLKGRTQFQWTGYYYRCAEVVGACGGDEVPPYTTDLNAVMALVPANLYIVCLGEFKDGFETDGKRWFAKLCQRSPHKPLPPTGAPNAARALLAAILRAMEAGQ